MERAVEDLVSAVTVDPSSTTGFNSLGLALCEQGRHDEALAAIDKALAASPRNAVLLSNRGMVNYSTGDLVEAIKVRRLSPVGVLGAAVSLFV